MSAVAIVVVAMVVIFLITAVLLLRHIGASPKQQYGRELRGIQRIRKGNRAGDPARRRSV
jgi:preprotein translocase subunit SecG